MQEKSAKSASRRQFLTIAGLGTLAAGAVVGVAGEKAEAATPLAGPAQKSGGYQETELVKRYYELARF